MASKKFLIVLLLGTFNYSSYCSSFDRTYNISTIENYLRRIAESLEKRADNDSGTSLLCSLKSIIEQEISTLNKKINEKEKDLAVYFRGSPEAEELKKDIKDLQNQKMRYLETFTRK